MSKRQDRQMRWPRAIWVRVLAVAVSLGFAVPLIATLAPGGAQAQSPAGAVIIFQRPNSLFGLGHTGWGYYDTPSGTWTFGGVEGGGSIYISPGQWNGTWNTVGGSWSDMINQMNNLGYTNAVYMTTASANSAAANGAVAAAVGAGYNTACNNCADQTYNVLSGYGATLPDPGCLQAPNAWVNSVQSTVPNVPYDVPTVVQDPPLFDPIGGGGDDDYRSSDMMLML